VRLQWSPSDERYSPVRKSTDKEIIMTDHRDLAAQSGRTSWRLSPDSIPSLLTGAAILIGYVALLGTDILQSAQSAPKPEAASGPAIAYAMDAAREERPAGDQSIQTYTAWLQAAHAHAAVHGQDAPLPNQF